MYYELRKTQSWYCFLAMPCATVSLQLTTVWKLPHTGVNKVQVKQLYLEGKFGLALWLSPDDKGDEQTDHCQNTEKGDRPGCKSPLNSYDTEDTDQNTWRKRTHTSEGRNILMKEYFWVVVTLVDSIWCRSPSLTKCTCADVDSKTRQWRGFCVWRGKQVLYGETIFRLW